MQNPQSLQTTCVHVPPEATILYGIQEFLTNSRKYLCTFQLFIDATRQQFFGHNNIRVMNTSVGFIFQIFLDYVECMFVIHNLHPIAIQSGCR